ncbi:STAS domain-containing protein [Candidatus Riflebacteria bacterium]
MDLKYSIQYKNDDQGKYLYVEISGKISFMDLDRLEDDLTFALDARSCPVVFDFKKVEFIDSRGLDFLITFHKRQEKENFNIKLINVNDYIYDLLHTVFFHKLFPILKEGEIE